MLHYFPKYFSSKAIYLYLAALVACNLYFFSRSLPLVWWLFGLVQVIGFFYFSNQLSRKWAFLSTKTFVKKVFFTALVLRVVWVIFSYFFYLSMTGQPFEFWTADAMGYHSDGMWIMDLIRKGDLKPYYAYIQGRYSDMGYPFYLGWLYSITDGSIMMARLLKAFYGAFSCVLIYKLATRNFGEGVGRMATVFCVLMPNLIYYTGVHLKETEMLLLTVAFMERADYLLRSNKFNVLNIILPLLLAGLLFFFRTVLGATALFALFTALIFSSTRVLGMGKRTLLVVWVLVAAGYFVGGKISTEVEALWMARDMNQQTSMEWRSTRDNGNAFSKYASGAVFAPLILVIPFPTIVNTPGQENQQLINGGNYVKNIMAFFALLALYSFVKNKKWREYVLIISFTLGYLVVIAVSAFAHSERFHLPALPFVLILAAVGVAQVTNKTKKYFTWYTVFLFVALLAWSWFKLAGRGLA